MGGAGHERVQPAAALGLQERACGGEQMHGALQVVLPDGDRGERLEVVGDAWFVPGLGRLRHPFLQAFRRAGQIALCLAAERQVVERDEDGEPVLRAGGPRSGPR